MSQEMRIGLLCAGTSLVSLMIGLVIGAVLGLGAS